MDPLVFCQSQGLQEREERTGNLEFVFRLELSRQGAMQADGLANEANAGFVTVSAPPPFAPKHRIEASHQALYVQQQFSQR